MSDDAEQCSRLRSILRGIAGANECDALKTTFGSASITECRALYEDGNGRVFAVVKSIDGGQEGVVIKEKGGQIAMILGAGFAAGWQLHLNSNNPPILSSSGDIIWLPQSNTSDPPKLLSLKTMEFVDTIPNMTFRELLAVSRDGRVFVTELRCSPIMAYTPHANGTESPLRYSHVASSSHHFAITDVGSVWATDQSGQLIRFNGSQWNPVPGTTNKQVDAMISGHDDTVLVCRDIAATLYQGNQEIASADLFDLIEQHRDLIRKAFGPRSSDMSAVQYAGRSSHALVADRDGNIWCVQPQGRLLVYTDDRWQDVNEALTAAGSKEGHAALLGLIGDGSSVFVTDLAIHWNVIRSFIGQVRDGKLKFVAVPDKCSNGFDGPHTVLARRVPPDVYDNCHGDIFFARPVNVS